MKAHFSTIIPGVADFRERHDLAMVQDKPAKRFGVPDRNRREGGCRMIEKRPTRRFPVRSKLLVVLMGFLVAAALWAHHGSAGFDQNKPVHFSGKITKVEWTNPHVVVHVDVAGAGKTVTWLVNTRPPNAAKRSGFPESTFATGTEVTVDGFQAIDGSNRVNGTSIAFPDGRRITTPECFTSGEFCIGSVEGKGHPAQ